MMPPEIADSDAESDGADNDLLHEMPGLVQNVQTSQQPSLSNIDFDQFIDPTQRLSESSPSQSVLPLKSTGSTEKMLQRLERDGLIFDGSSLENNQERNHTSQSRNIARSATDHDSQVVTGSDGKRRRPRTYGSESTQRKLADVNLFAGPTSPPPISPISQDIHGLTPADEDHEGASPVVDGQSRMTQPQTLPRERDRPRRVVSLLEQSPNRGLHQYTTSTSSMGGYQSMNLNFRGSTNGLDIHANPFGIPSQVSVTDGINPAEIMRVPDETSNELDGLSNRHLALEQVQAEVMNSPEDQTASSRKGNTTAKSKLLMEPLDSEHFESSDRPSKRRKTDASPKPKPSSPAPSRRAASVISDSTSNVAEKPMSGKGGRKSKSSKLTSVSPAPADIAEIQAGTQDDVQQEDQPLSSRRRGSTRPRKGTLESSSQVSAEPEPISNTKRKRRKSQTQDTQQESSPTKPSASDLNLSDEAVIGLPKENYIPRPSRSRSKRSADQPVEMSKTAPSQALVSEEQHVEAESQSSKPAKGKGKKSKVKRAKTSAAALLKKSEPMISDGEDDVVWVDEKPAAVKLDLPPDIRVLKKEEPQPSESKKATSIISVEIPAIKSDTTAGKLAESQSQDPRKRGRKSKKPEVLEPEPEPEEAIKEDIPQPREALAAKDVNVVQPIAQTEKSQQTPTATPPKDIDKASQSPGKENVSPSKGPTQHSPINPPNPFRTSTRYRIGLSKRQSIPSLLRKVNKDKPPPKKTSVKVQELKVKANDDDEENEGNGNSGPMRDANGHLVEWF